MHKRRWMAIAVDGGCLQGWGDGPVYPRALRAGRTPDDSAVKEALERLEQVPPAHTYTVALHTVAACAADPTKYGDAIKRNVAWLAETQTMDGAARGGWSYGPQRSTRGDGSNTRFAVWAMNEADQVGVSAPDTTWQAAIDYWLHSQHDDGSWGYTRYTPQLSTGTVTMTLAGIASLAAVRRSTADAALQRDIDAAIARAWKWHDARFSVEQPGQRSSWQFYALQALGLAASLTEHGRIGDSVWRDRATPVLLKLQDARDGSWQGQPTEPPLIATSMAILFLTSSSTKDNSTARRAPPSEQPDLVWGPPTRGLQAAVEFVPQQESYAFGNVLGVRFHVRNVSDQTIRFSSELARQGDHPTVLNKAGHEQRVAGVENTNWPQLFPFAVKPGQEAVLNVYPLGVYETEEQGRRFKHTAGNYLVCAPGHYTIRYTVNLGNIVEKDAAGSQIVPAEGDWVGTVDTGPVPLEVRRQSDGSLPSVRATEAEKPPAVTAAVAEEAIVQREAIEHKAHLDETARLLEQQAGGICARIRSVSTCFAERYGMTGTAVTLLGSMSSCPARWTMQAKPALSSMQTSLRSLSTSSDAMTASPSSPRPQRKLQNSRPRSARL